MKMRKLITTRPHRYGTRHLVAGEEYEAPAKHAAALVAGRKARFAPAVPEAVPEVVEVKEKSAAQSMAEAVEDLTVERLRRQAEALGVDVDGRWGMARLQYEITQARKT